MVFNATFNIIQLYRGDQVEWSRKPEYPEKTTDLSQVTAWRLKKKPSKTEAVNETKTDIQSM